MPVLLLNLVARLGVPERWRGIAAWGGLLLAALALYGSVRGGIALWFAWHDKAVVAADRTAANAKLSARQIDAERASGASKDARDQAIATNQSDLQEKTDAAAANGTSPLDALFDELH